MNVEQEIIKMQINEDIKKFIVGAIIEPDMTKVRDTLIEKCKVIGLDFSEIEKQCKSEMPPKRKYSEIISDTKIDGIERGLYLAFETLLSGKKLDTRKLTDQSEKEKYSNGFKQEHRDRCRMDILRALCISLKNSTHGYNQKGVVNLNDFLKQQGINHNLRITEKQLDYIHSLELDNIEQFSKSVDLTLLPQELNKSIEVWKTIDKRGDKYDYLYEKNEKNAYRIYINLSGNSDKADTFITDYIKMCINRKIPFSMKGHQGKEEDSKDNTVLYISEDKLLEYLQILDELSIIHSDTIRSFGEPPLLTQKLKSRIPNVQDGWFGFADLGQDGCATYNDRTKKSCINAFIATIYSELSYESKRKLQDKGYSTKALGNMASFNISYKQFGKKRRAIFLEEPKSSKLKSTLSIDGDIQDSNETIARDILSICNKEITKIVQTPEKKQKMFNKFKDYYVLMENYFKYNYNSSNEFSYEDYKKLPTTISMQLYKKYQDELNNEKPFFQVYQEGMQILSQGKNFSEQEIGKATIDRPTIRKEYAQQQERRDEEEVFKAER